MVPLCGRAAYERECESLCLKVNLLILLLMKMLGWRRWTLPEEDKIGDQACEIASYGDNATVNHLDEEDESSG